MHVFFLHNKKKTSRAKTDDKQNNFRTERTDTERLLGHLRTHGVLRCDDSQLVDCWHKHTETIEFASEDS